MPTCRGCSSTGSTTPATCSNGPLLARRRPGWPPARWPSCCCGRSGAGRGRGTDPTASSRRIVTQLLEETGLALAPPLAEFGSTSAAKATALSECTPALLSQFALAGQEQDLVVRRVR